MERLGALALRAAAVCGDAVLSPGGTVQSEHSSTAGSMTPTPPLVSEEVKFCQQQPLCFWNDACVLKLCPRLLIGVARSQLYVQRFQIPEGHLQRQVQPPCDHPLSREAQGSKGSSKGKEKGGIVPIRSGKCAPAGLKIFILGLEQGTKIRNDGRGTIFRNVKS